MLLHHPQHVDSAGGAAHLCLVPYIEVVMSRSKFDSSGCVTQLGDSFMLQLATNVLSSRVPLIRSHGGGFGLAEFSWLLQDLGNLTHWAAAGTLNDLGGVWSAAGPHTPDHEFTHFQLHHLVIDCVLHKSAREHAGL